MTAIKIHMRCANQPLLVFSHSLKRFETIRLQFNRNSHTLLGLFDNVFQTIWWKLLTRLDGAMYVRPGFVVNPVEASLNRESRQHPVLGTITIARRHIDGPSLVVQGRESVACMFSSSQASVTRSFTPGHWFITEIAKVLSFSLHLCNIIHFKIRSVDYDYSNGQKQKSQFL